MAKNLFFSVKNLSDDEGEIRISGEITKWAWEEFGETSSLIFARQLQQLKNTKKIAVKINSPGGDISEALSIYHELKRLSKEKEVTAYIDGMACSAATLIAIAAGKTVMGKGCYFMIHNPLIYMGYSNAEEMQKAIEHLNKTKENILDLYEEKSSLSREEIAKKMDEETFFNAQESLEAGFIDEIADYETSIVNSNIANVCTMSLKNSKKIPQALSDILNKKTKEEKMADNVKFTNVEKQIFHGDYPLVSQPLTVKNAVKAGDVIGVDASGNYGKYDESTYTTPYAVAYEDAEASKECSCILSAYLVESFVLLPEDAGKKLKLKQELRKIGLFLR